VFATDSVSFLLVMLLSTCPFTPVG
jgi:hypothetical protein